MKKWVELDFEISDFVFLKTDKDQMKRVITAISVRPGGISYELTCGITSSWHYNFEISKEIDVLTKVMDE